MNPKLMFMKSSVLLQLTLTVAAGTILGSCSSDDGSDEIPPIKVEFNKVTQTEFAARNNAFANNLLANLATKEATKNSNIIVSPISMQYLLSMMANTASDEARAEVFTTLELNGYTMAETNEYSKLLLDRLQQDNQYVKASLCNSAWIAEGTSLTSEAENSIKNSYNADIVYHDFTNKANEATSLIGQWASEKTDGMVTQVPCSPTKDTKIILANATFFNGKWSNPFNARHTYQHMFYNEDGSQSQVSMMSQNMTTLVYADENTSIAELTYGRGYYSMMIVMPKDIKQQISDKIDWWQLHNKLTKAKLDIVLPRFKIRNDWNDLISVSREMGINKMFNEILPGMVSGSDIMFIALGQSTMIEVEENGTKAASTSIGSGDTVTLDPTILCFDHPFIFAIRENTTGTILFIGKVGKL